MPKWPENPDEPVDPAIAPLIEAGEGEAEGFDVAESDLIEHAEHGDQHGTGPIWRDAAGFDAAEDRARRRGLRRGGRRGSRDLNHPGQVEAGDDRELAMIS